jgi:hypothetical protein
VVPKLGCTSPWVKVVLAMGTLKPMVGQREQVFSSVRTRPDNGKMVLLHKPIYVLFPADTRGPKPIDMEECYWALLFMPLVILHHLLNVFVQLANKRGFKQKKNYRIKNSLIVKLLLSVEFYFIF